MALLGFIKKIFGSRNQRLVKQMMQRVTSINALESQMQALSDDELRANTAKFRERLTQGETIEALLPEAFATVREASKRVLNMRHFDVQLVGGMALHSGRIAEMHTGEGKTLVATTAVYLNALTGLGVHVVTVNDYLARRDAMWMGPLYQFLGLSVGINLSGLDKSQKQAAYAADITYGTNNEFGFDYLRDNMVFNVADKAQRQLHFAVIDEVDSILIDEARTPLIISGQAEDSSEFYRRIDGFIPRLIRQKDENDLDGDYTVDEKAKQVFLTEKGHETIESLMVSEGLLASDQSLYDAGSVTLLHHIYAGLRAHALFHRDVDYLVRNQEVIIVDEHTGRTMVGRRWSEGLHQAVEAKEQVPIKPENQTLASITFQNYFRLYQKLSGMTGTADTEAFEFQQIYGLEVMVIPTNQPPRRDDRADLVFLSAEDKYKAVITDIKETISKQQPVLVGTASIETSEFLAALLQKEGIEHKVLNAKFHEQEAMIIAEAGRPGVVTIATNMAGRGTDSVLGGSLEEELKKLPPDATAEQTAACKAQWQQRHDLVVSVGGLHVVGSERHESRRIDNQLRGRSGRQGDPGSTRFYLSLDDNLMRIFASPTLRSMMEKLGMEPGQAIESSLVSRAIENAQRKVEGRNFDIRKQLLQYDDVANEQRKVIYEQRAQLMQSDDVSKHVQALIDDVIAQEVQSLVPLDTIEEQWQLDELHALLQRDFGMNVDIHAWLKEDEKLHAQSLNERLVAFANKHYLEKETDVGAELLRQIERNVMLQCLDSYWKEHLVAMDHLRQSVSLRGFAQKDPKQEYKREAFALFGQLLERVRHDVVSVLFKLQIETQTTEPQEPDEQSMHFEHPDPNALVLEEEDDENKPINMNVSEGSMSTLNMTDQPKIGRNDPCYCGSGRKFKQCHGRI